MPPSPIDDAPRTHDEARVRATACVAGVAFERGLDLDAALERMRDPETVVWVDALRPSEADLERIRDELGVHPLAIEDFTSDEPRTFVRELRDQVHARVPFTVPGAEAARELAAFDLVIGRGFVLTVRRGDAPFLEEAGRRWALGGALLGEGVGFITYAILDTVVDGYVPVVEAIAERLEDVEASMFGSIDERRIEELVAIRRSLLRLRRALLPLREVLVPLLERRRPDFGTAMQPYFAELAEHLRRIGQLVDGERDTVASTLDAWLMLGSHRLNEAMRTLTSISAITGVAGAVFGAWGMNLVKLPLSEDPVAFVAIVGSTVGLVATALRVAIAKRWL